MEYNKFDFDEVRIQKRQEIINKNSDPYPYSYNQDIENQKVSIDKIDNILNKVKSLEESNSDIGFSASIVGRVWSKRLMGKALFIDINDSTEKIQIYLKEENLSHNWEVSNLLDIGDLIGITGELFRTKTGEITLRVKKLDVLAKATVDIPVGKETEDKVYFRASDPEIKYRERYLHWLLDKNDRDKILLRSRIISTIRRTMESNGFLDVQTPTIEAVYGGAEARPFKTNIWALDNSQAFLRISPELYLKRYLVAGFDKIFTICQNFRNEGIDHSHNPEFTMMEWYEAFTDYNFQMKRFENLVASVCQEICGSTKIDYQGTEIDFSPPWRRLTVIEAIKEYTNLDVETMTVDDIKVELDKRKIDYDDSITWGTGIVILFEETCEKQLIQPVFITDHPIDISPLTKVKRGNDKLVERFEPYVYGIEIGNAYSELTDPIIQMERLVDQRKNDGQEEGYENHPIDVDFVKAIGCGMPPTGGVGLGIDRLVMFLTNSPTIRDIIPFPMYKAKK